MRTNARGCLEIAEQTAPDQWQSIVVFGQYEELPDLPEYEAARVKAHELLQKLAYVVGACLCGCRASRYAALCYTDFLPHKDR